MKRKIGFLILFLLLSICIALPAMADEPLYEGTCGDTVNWKYDPDTHELIIFGTGAMYNYKDDGRPWYNFRHLIRSVSVLEGVTVIGERAFSTLTRLEYVDIAEGVTTISKSAFHNCDTIIELNLPSTITTVHESAFNRCERLTELYFTDQLSYIGEAAFSGCESLSLEIPVSAKVTEIPKFCFAGCKALTSIQIPKGVTTIGELAFSNCSALTEVILPNGLTEIGEGSFRNCLGLTSISIPDTVTEIGARAFADCDLLKTVTLPEGITSITSELFSKSGIVNIVLPNSVTRIEAYAFQECEDLKSIVFSESLERIAGQAFTKCYSLEVLTIPASIMRIQEYAFAGCTGLKELSFMGGQNLYLASNSFANCNKLETVKFMGGQNLYLADNSFSKCIELETVKFYDCTTRFNAIIPNNIAKIAEWMCDWRETTVHSAPTHTSEGSSTFTCAKCHKAVTRATEKLKEHVFNPAIPVSETIHKRICICGHEEKSPHNWDEGEITLEPTKRKEGARVHTCVDCGNKYTEILPKEESAVSPLVVVLLAVGGVAILGTALGIPLWLSLRKKRRAA